MAAGGVLAIPDPRPHSREVGLPGHHRDSQAEDPRPEPGAALRLGHQRPDLRGRSCELRVNGAQAAEDPSRVRQRSPGPHRRQFVEDQGQVHGDGCTAQQHALRLGADKDVRLYASGGRAAAVVDRGGPPPGASIELAAKHLNRVRPIRRAPPQAQSAGVFENAFLERVFPNSSEARHARKLSAARSYG